MTGREDRRQWVPDVGQTTGMTVLLEGPAPSTHRDANGHVGVVGHMAMYAEAGWPWMAGLGLDPSLPGSTSTLMDRDHHIRYLSEIMVGDEVAVHGVLLGRDARRVHGFWAILNRARRRVAGTLEFVSTFVDLETRRSADFPPALARRLDASVEADAKQVPTGLDCCLYLPSDAPTRRGRL